MQQQKWEQCAQRHRQCSEKCEKPKLQQCHHAKCNNDENMSNMIASNNKPTIRISTTRTMPLREEQQIQSNDDDNDYLTTTETLNRQHEPRRYEQKMIWFLDRSWDCQDISVRWKINQILKAHWEFRIGIIRIAQPNKTSVPGARKVEPPWRKSRRVFFSSAAILASVRLSFSHGWTIRGAGIHTRSVQTFLSARSIGEVLP